jgi:hypothetical protein
VVARHVLLVALVAADVWGVATLVNAITGGKGRSAVFWTAVALIGIATAGLVWWTVRVARGAAGRLDRRS